MYSWQDRLKVAPLWKIGLGYGIFFGLLIGLPALLLAVTDGTSGPTLLLFLLAVAVPVIVVVAVAVERQREFQVTGGRSREERLEMAYAMRTGEPPTDTSLDEPLLGLIERGRRLRRRWLHVWMPLAVLFILVAMVGALTGTWNLGGSGGVLFGVIAAGAVVSRRSDAQRLLEERIRDRSGGSAPSG